ncbi:hypothetical protein [Halomarina oriensis]|uniref:Rpa-associated protein n=1 Tax=Halomarina oriensis TaxID=671145 RepID=A0A6B0GJA1_9EURY|nr:hypothetical protein [Halomarina oriensis]MWG33937.1 hypothetical protein [Halomarina oriensis]
MSGSTPGNREVAHRLFAAEFEDASYSYSESDEERAPNYVVTPTGARVNRLFATGVLTEVAQAGDSILRARVVDPTGAFVVYAGQYQPEAMSFLDTASTPSFVAVTGKARTFQPEDSDLVYTSVRPESVSEVDAPTRDRWTVTAAERTLERIGVFAAALDTGLTGDALTQALREAGVDASLAAGIPIAIEQYGTTTAYLAALQEVALDAVRLVADEVDAVGDLDRSPGEGGDVSFSPVLPADVDVAAGAAGVVDTASDVADEGTAPEGETPDPAAASEGADATGDAVEEPAETPVEEGVDVGDEPSGEPVAETDGAEQTAAERTDMSADEEPAFEETAGNGVSDEPAFDTSEDETDDAEAEADPGAYEMDEETREEVEAEFGTDFSTGSEVPPAGEADIETPERESEDAVESAAETTTDATDATTDPDEPSFEPTGGDETVDDEPAFEPTETDESAVDDGTDAATDSDAGSESESPAAVESESPADTDTASDAEADADVDLETALLEEMKALDDGDGAPRDELVTRVGDRTGADEDTVADAIQDALMSGQCYEPEDGRLKPI